MKLTLTERFWAKVDSQGSGCWLWNASQGRFGYGQIRAVGRSGKPRMIAAHRVSWELAHGRMIPIGIHVLHRCDVPQCVRPSHLMLGTNEENAADRDAKGRNPKGESHGMVRLSVTEVYQVRKLVAQGMSQARVGERYGIRQQHVSKICSGQTWKHLWSIKK